MSAVDHLYLLTSGRYMAPAAVLDLTYGLEWRPRLWRPTLTWLLGDLQRFRGKRILELGCRRGRMSCFFASLGAQCDGVDVDGEALEIAAAESARWGLTQRTCFLKVNPDLTDLPKGVYDFVFTKSVLVMMGNLGHSLARIAPLLKSDGEYLAAENQAAGVLVSVYRRLTWQQRSPRLADSFAGIDKSSIGQFKKYFKTIETRPHLGLVVGIRARQPIVLNNCDDLPF